MAPKYAKFHGESDGKGPEVRDGPKQAENQKFGSEIFPWGVRGGPIGPPGKNLSFARPPRHTRKHIRDSFLWVPLLHPGAERPFGGGAGEFKETSDVFGCAGAAYWENHRG